VFERKRAAKERAEQAEQKKQAQKMAEAKARRDELAEQKRLKGLEEKRRIQQQIEEADEKKRQREENLKRQAAKRRQQMLLLKQQQELQQLQQEEIAALEEQQQELTGMNSSFGDEDEDLDASFGANNSAAHGSSMQSPSRSQQDSRRSVSPRRNLSSGATSTHDDGLSSNRSSSPRGRPQSPRRGGPGAAISSPNIISPGRPGGRSTSPRRTLSRSDLSPRRTPSRSDLSSNHTPRGGNASSLYPPKASPYASIVNSHQDRIDFANEWEHLGEGDASEAWRDHGVSMAEEVAREAEVTAVRLERQKRAAPERKRSLRASESQDPSRRPPVQEQQQEQQQNQQGQLQEEAGTRGIDEASATGSTAATETSNHSTAQDDSSSDKSSSNTSGNSSTSANSSTFLTSKQQALHALAAQRRRFNEPATSTPPLPPGIADTSIADSGDATPAVPPADSTKASSIDLTMKLEPQQNTLEDQKPVLTTDTRINDSTEVTTNLLQKEIAALSATAAVEVNSKNGSNIEGNSNNDNNEIESNSNEFVDAQDSVIEDDGHVANPLMNGSLPLPAAATSVAVTATNDNGGSESPSSQLSLAPARSMLSSSREPSLLSPPREIPSAAAWIVAPTPSSVPPALSSVTNGHESMPPAVSSAEVATTSSPASSSASTLVASSEISSSSENHQQKLNMLPPSTPVEVIGQAPAANLLGAYAFSDAVPDHQRSSLDTAQAEADRSVEHVAHESVPNHSNSIISTLSASSLPATPPRLAPSSPTNRANAAASSSPPSSPRSLSLRNYASAFQGPKADACEQMWWKFENTAKEFNFLRQFTQDKSSPSSAAAAAATSAGSSAPSMQFWLDLQRNANDPLKDAAGGLVNRGCDCLLACGACCELTCCVRAQ